MSRSDVKTSIACSDKKDWGTFHRQLKDRLRDVKADIEAHIKDVEDTQKIVTNFRANASGNGSDEEENSGGEEQKWLWKSLFRSRSTPEPRGRSREVGRSNVRKPSPNAETRSRARTDLKVAKFNLERINAILSVPQIADWQLADPKFGPQAGHPDLLSVFESDDVVEYIQSICVLNEKTMNWQWNGSKYSEAHYPVTVAIKLFRPSLLLDLIQRVRTDYLESAERKEHLRVNYRISEKYPSNFERSVEKAVRDVGKIILPYLLHEFKGNYKGTSAKVPDESTLDYRTLELCTGYGVPDFGFDGECPDYEHPLVQMVVVASAVIGGSAVKTFASAIANSLPNVAENHALGTGAVRAIRWGGAFGLSTSLEKSQEILDDYFEGALHYQRRLGSEESKKTLAALERSFPRKKRARKVATKEIEAVADDETKDEEGDGERGGISTTFPTGTKILSSLMVKYVAEPVRLTTGILLILMLLQAKTVKAIVDSVTSEEDSAFPSPVKSADGVANLKALVGDVVKSIQGAAEGAGAGALLPGPAARFLLLEGGQARRSANASPFSSSESSLQQFDRLMELVVS
jgi:hypothetical protein